MGFIWGTTCFKCRIAISIASLLSVILIRIKNVIAKSQIFRRLWYRQLFTVGQTSLQVENLGISLCFCIWRWSLLCLLNKGNNRLRCLVVPSKPWKRRTAFDANHLSILWEASHTVRKKYEGPKFYLVTKCTTKIKLITFLNERGKISSLRFEGQFTSHVTEGVRMIQTLPWHDENIINTVLLHKTLH